MKISFTTALAVFIAILPLQFLWRQSAIQLVSSENQKLQALGAAMMAFES